MKRLLAIARLLAAAVLVQGCSMDYDGLADDRIKYAKRDRGVIGVVAIEGAVETDYIKGVQLAVQQINERPNKLLGRSLTLSVEEGGDEFEGVLSTIQDISANPKVTAVLGHPSSAVAIPASVIYEKSKIVFLPSFATSKGLTNHDFNFVFRMAPNSLVMAKQLASLASILGYRKIVSLYSFDDYSREFAFSFEDAALSQGIDFAFRSAFSAEKANYRSMISQFKNKQFDAVFISSETESSVRMIRQLRDMGLDAPILSGDGIEPKLFTELAAGADADNTIMPTSYRTHNKTALNRDFRELYRNAYRIEADYNAAQGYDSVMMLAAAIEKAKSTMPISVSSAMQNTPYWHGVTGLHGFTEQGELIGKHYYFQVFKRGRWILLPAVDIPFTLEALEEDIKFKRPGQDLTLFSKELSHRVHPIDFRKINLDLAHEILQFQSLGWIYDNSLQDALSDEQNAIRGLADRKGFVVKECGIPFSKLSAEDARQRLIECYGVLASSIHALYLSVSPKMDRALMARLNRSLKSFKVPVIAFRDKNTPLEMDVTIAISRTNLELKSPEAIEAFSGILTKIKAFELVDKLADMPVIFADLAALQDFGYIDAEVLTLAPHPNEGK